MQIVILKFQILLCIFKKTEMYKLAFIQCLTIKYFPILKKPNAYEIRDGKQSTAAYCNAHR